MKTDSSAHDAIAQHARKIWESEGQPTGRDIQIWLNAEQQLSTPATTAAARIKSETAAESVVEFHLPSSTSEDAAVSAALQTPESRRTKPPVKSAPQLAATAQVRGAGNSQSTTTLAADPKTTSRAQEPASIHPHEAPAPSPAETAAKAQQQKNAARTPHLSVKTAPNKTPPESGKPLWDRPHSS